MGLVGLETVGRKRVGRYSQGMLQRLAIGLALLGNPEILLLDEPTNSLDPKGIHWMRGLISQLTHSGKAIFLTSHQLTEVERVCSRVAIINKGRILRTGPLATVLPRQEQVLLFVEDATAAWRSIAQEPWAAEARIEGEAIVVVRNGNNAEVARQRLDQAGHPVLRMEERLATLEEGFAALTEDSS
jgi:ABC-type multidrug transport system ATPase subunit